MIKIDKIDQEILKLLQKNAELTNKEIAASLKMSPTPIFERIKKLKKNGVITHFTAIIDRNKVGKDMLIFCNVIVKEHSEQKLKKFEKEIREIPEVTECFLISGSADYLLKVIVENMPAYNDFLNKLSKFENIGNTNSIMILRQIKNDTRIPL